MQTRTTRTGADALRKAAWAATALAGAASLLHWMTTSTDTHSWSADAVLSLVAGGGLMTLAIALAAGPWTARATRAVALIGAVGTAAVVLAFVLLALLDPAITGTDGHAGHGAGGVALSSIEVVRTVSELGLIGVLAWLHRLAGRHRPDETPAAG